MMYYVYPGSQPHLGTIVILGMLLAAALLVWSER